MKNDQRGPMTYVQERVGVATESEDAYLDAWKKGVANSGMVCVDKKAGID